MKPKYHKTLQAIRECIQENGYPPSYQEIADRTGIGTSTASYHVKKLREIGYVKTAENTNRSIQLT